MGNGRLRCILLAGSAIASIGGGSAAFGQDGAASKDDQNVIIVTARFREADVQDIGGSIVAFGEEELISKGISSTADLARAVPSLNIQERGPNRNEFNIRGVTNLVTIQDVLPSARPVGIYVDDAPLNTLGGAQIDVRTFDLNRIEVLRGPQGTLFGEGSSAGAVRYFTTDPDLSSFGGKAEVESVFMSKGGQELGVRGALNVPLVEDTIGLRVSGGRYATPGFLDVIEGDRNINDYSAVNFRAVLLAEPNDNLTIRIAGTWEESDSGSLGQATGDPDDFSTALPLNDDDISDDYYHVTGKIEYDFGSFVATSITSYFDRTRKRNTYDQTNTVFLSLYSVNDPRFGFVDASQTKDAVYFNQFSQELRLVSNFDGPFQVTLGGFYRDFGYEVGNGGVISDRLRLLEGDTYFPPQPLNSGDSRVIAEALGLPNPYIILTDDGWQISGFVEAELNVTDRLKLIAGVRSHNEKIKASAPTRGTFSANTPVVRPGFTAKTTLKTLLPMASIEYRATDNVLLYGRFATGSRNGNVNSPATLALIEQFVGPGASVGLEGFGEDRTRTFEVGVKSTFLDGRVMLNAAAYHTKYSDLQAVIALPPLGFGLIQNAESATMKGFEIEGRADVSDSFSTYFGLSYVKAELSSDLVVNQLSGAFLPKGTPLPNTPDLSFTAGAELTRPTGIADTEWYINGGVSYTGEYSNQLAQDASVLGDFAVGNLGAGIRGDDWSLDLFVSNVTNKGAIVGQNDFDVTYQTFRGPLPIGVPVGIGGPPFVTFNEIFILPPRTIRLTLRKDF